MGLRSDKTMDGFLIDSLAPGSEKFVEVICDACALIFTRRWRDYRSSQVRYNTEGKTFCKACANKANGKKKIGKPLTSTAKTYRNKAPNFQEGRYVSSDGYVMVLVSPGLYKREHILKIEEHIGRPVNYQNGEVVHHIDLDRSNNVLSNLVLLESELKHRHAHKTLDALVPKIIKAGLIHYDPNTNSYMAVGKLRELLEQPEEANQQPSKNGDIFEGSTTRCESTFVDNKPPTSAGQKTKTSDDIV